MSRQRERDIYARTLLADKRSEARYIDIACNFVRDDNLESILSLGGRWDRKRKDWSDEEARSGLQFRMHTGQLEAAYFFEQWFKAYLTGNKLDQEYFSALLIGGSRAGKTNLGIRLPVAFAIAVPMSRVWVVAESEPAFDECETELDEIIPDSFAEKAGTRYTFVNGSKLWLRSGKYPHKLKRGRCDFAFLNEGQNVKELAYSMLRMRTSDTGGIVVVAANPPNDNEDGEWIGKWAEEFKAGRRKNTKVFHFDPNNNPHINRAQLEAMKDETDHRTYEIEVLGKVLPPSNAVYHSFSPIDNTGKQPDAPDVTESFASRIGLGQRCVDLVGMDFQRTPHMAAVIARVYENPKDELKPFIHYRSALLVELGDEYDLSDALYDYGLDPATAVIIGDASGDWQDAQRTKGGASFEILKQQGWKRVYKPDKRIEKNPPIAERMKNDNRLFCSESGIRIITIEDDCKELIDSIKTWRKKGALPDRRAKQAHVCDAFSYLNWRLYPRRVFNNEIGYKRLKSRQRGRQMRSF